MSDLVNIPYSDNKLFRTVDLWVYKKRQYHKTPRIRTCTVMLSGYKITYDFENCSYTVPSELLTLILLESKIYL